MFKIITCTATAGFVPQAYGALFSSDSQNKAVSVANKNNAITYHHPVGKLTRDLDFGTGSRGCCSENQKYVDENGTPFFGKTCDKFISKKKSDDFVFKTYKTELVIFENKEDNEIPASVNAPLLWVPGGKDPKVLKDLRGRNFGRLDVPDTSSKGLRCSKTFEAPDALDGTLILYEMGREDLTKIHAPPMHDPKVYYGSKDRLYEVSWSHALGLNDSGALVTRMNYEFAGRIEPKGDRKEAYTTNKKDLEMFLENDMYTLNAFGTKWTTNLISSAAFADGGSFPKQTIWTTTESVTLTSCEEQWFINNPNKVDEVIVDHERFHKDFKKIKDAVSEKPVFDRGGVYTVTAISYGGYEHKVTGLEDLKDQLKKATSTFTLKVRNELFWKKTESDIRAVTRNVAMLAEFISDLSIALEWLHGQGYVHRDLSFRNMMYFPEAKSGSIFKLIDFGIARTPGPHAAKKAIGDSLFMPPEAYTWMLYGHKFKHFKKNPIEYCRAYFLPAAASYNWDAWAFGLTIIEFICGETVDSVLDVQPSTGGLQNFYEALRRFIGNSPEEQAPVDQYLEKLQGMKTEWKTGIKKILQGLLKWNCSVDNFDVFGKQTKEWKKCVQADHNRMTMTEVKQEIDALIADCNITPINA